MHRALLGLGAGRDDGHDAAATSASLPVARSATIDAQRAGGGGGGGPGGGGGVPGGTAAAGGGGGGGGGEA
jgi:hypothetical protein